MSIVKSNQYIHSCYFKSNKDNILFVKEKEVAIDDNTSKVVDTKNHLKIMKNPKKKIWITKPQFRTHPYKKESEKISNCDMFILDDNHIPKTLIKELELDKNNPDINVFSPLRELCNSPYVYGVDIDMEALHRTELEKNQKHTQVPMTKGFLDIEQSVLGDEQINVITVICNGHIYTSILKEFMKDKSIEDVYQLANELLKDYFTEYNLTLHVEICEKEIDVIKNSINKLHESEVDYCGIWNMGYDIPTIIDRITKLKEDPNEIFSDPNVEKQYKYCKYIEDKRPVAHISDKWNWFDTTSQTQFIDMMLLFARIRKREPKRPSYSLDAIASSVLSDSKLHVKQAGHFEMQTNRFVEYVVYNIKDALLLYLIENKTNDITNLYGLTSLTRLGDFNKQGTMLKNSYQQYLLEHGYVLASVGKEMECPYDKRILKAGGAVADATNTRDMGVDCVIEHPGYITQLIPYTADQDYSSLYPSIKIACGICKEGKLATLLSIEDMDPEYIEIYCSAIAAMKENSVFIGHLFYNLPSYTEMEELIKNRLKKG